MAFLLPPFFPEQASTAAAEIDYFYFFMLAVCGGVGLTIMICITVFAIKYRRRYEGQLAIETHESPWAEWGWTIVPFFVFMVMFYWSALIFFKHTTIPKNTLDVYVTGKQWMWKFQHLDGQREINQLHVPLGRPVRLVMSSEDVIHSFFVPAFRIHMDVLPKKTSYTWFEATKTGTFHLFCSQYCGTEHAGMIGSVIVMEPQDYEKWLISNSQGSMAIRGQELFNKLACNACHTGNAQARAPYLNNLYRKPITLESGEQVIVDENYIRESIYKPNAKIAAGYANIMPSYEGQLTEEEIQLLVAYIRAMGSGFDQMPPVSNPTGVQPYPAGGNPDGSLPYKAGQANQTPATGVPAPKAPTSAAEAPKAPQSSETQPSKKE